MKELYVIRTHHSATHKNKFAGAINLTPLVQESVLVRSRFIRHLGQHTGPVAFFRDSLCARDAEITAAYLPKLVAAYRRTYGTDTSDDSLMLDRLASLMPKSPAFESATRGLFDLMSTIHALAALHLTNCPVRLYPTEEDDYDMQTLDARDDHIAQRVLTAPEERVILFMGCGHRLQQLIQLSQYHHLNTALHQGTLHIHYYPHQLQSFVEFYAKHFSPPCSPPVELHDDAAVGLEVALNTYNKRLDEITEELASDKNIHRFRAFNNDPATYLREHPLPFTRNDDP